MDMVAASTLLSTYHRIQDLIQQAVIVDDDSESRRLWKTWREEYQQQGPDFDRRVREAIAHLCRQASPNPPHFVMLEDGTFVERGNLRLA